MPARTTETNPPPGLFTRLVGRAKKHAVYRDFKKATPPNTLRKKFALMNKKNLKGNYP
jgi:hypothetical protein